MVFMETGNDRLVQPSGRTTHLQPSSWPMIGRPMRIIPFPYEARTSVVAACSAWTTPSTNARGVPMMA
jgi:hypothetical protein